MTRVITRRRAAAAICVLALLVSGCSDDGGDSGTPVLDLSETGPGTCLDVPDQLGETVTKLPVIDCAKEHTHEIYAVVPYDDSDVFPGDEALNAFAERSCVGAFEPYVEISVFDSSLLMTWLVPTLSSWNDEDDKDVLCVLADFQAAPLKGSMRGAKR